MSRVQRVIIFEVDHDSVYGETRSVTGIFELDMSIGSPVYRKRKLNEMIYDRVYYLDDFAVCFEDPHDRDSLPEDRTEYYKKMKLRRETS